MPVRWIAEAAACITLQQYSAACQLPCMLLQMRCVALCTLIFWNPETFPSLALHAPLQTGLVPLLPMMAKPMTCQHREELAQVKQLSQQQQQLQEQGYRSRRST
jgi:hypothetical protein